MNSFKIKDTEFGVGDIQFSLEDNLVNLEITGDETIFDKLTEDDDSEWGWALDPPQIYFCDIPYNGKRIVVNNDFLEEYDACLYMMEHNDFIGTLEITDNNIRISGQVNLSDEVLPLSIIVERSDC